MKFVYYVFTLLFVTTILCACSPINSVAPFDDQQARILAKDYLQNAKPLRPLNVNAAQST